MEHSSPAPQAAVAPLLQKESYKFNSRRVIRPQSTEAQKDFPFVFLCLLVHKVREEIKFTYPNLFRGSGQLSSCSNANQLALDHPQTRVPNVNRSGHI